MSDQSFSPFGPWGFTVVALDIAARADTGHESRTTDTAPKPALHTRVAALVSRIAGASVSAGRKVIRSSGALSRTATAG